MPGWATQIFTKEFDTTLNRISAQVRELILKRSDGHMGNPARILPALPHHRSQRVPTARGRLPESLIDFPPRACNMRLRKFARSYNHLLLPVTHEESSQARTFIHSDAPKRGSGRPSFPLEFVLGDLHTAPEHVFRFGELELSAIDLIFGRLIGIGVLEYGQNTIRG